MSGSGEGRKPMVDGSKAAAISEGAQADRMPDAGIGELRGILAGVLYAEIGDINDRRQHAKNINPVVVGVAKDVRWMRWGITILAAAIPVALLAFLLWGVCHYWQMFLGGEFDRTKVEAIRALAAPMTALVVGTFASFIFVYYALLAGVFRSAPKDRDGKQERGISSVVAQMAQKIFGNGA